MARWKRAPRSYSSRTQIKRRREVVDQHGGLRRAGKHLLDVRRHLLFHPGVGAGERYRLRADAELLNPEGRLLHTFWYGKGEEEHSGLRSVYYTRETLTVILGKGFDIQTFEMYAEINEDDSFYIVATPSG